jgi:hypothetical protein
MRGMRVQSPGVEGLDEIGYALSLHAYVGRQDIVAHLEMAGHHLGPRTHTHNGLSGTQHAARTTGRSGVAVYLEAFLVEERRDRAPEFAVVNQYLSTPQLTFRV